MKKLFLPLLLVISMGLIGSAQDNSDAEDTLEERLQPYGNVCMEGEDCGVAAPAIVISDGGRSGIEIYEKHCFACHATGLQNAPLVGSDAWQERVAKGNAVMLENTRNGFNVVMPPMGTCMDCTDGELQAAIDYMVTGQE